MKRLMIIITLLCLAAGDGQAQPDTTAVSDTSSARVAMILVEGSISPTATNYINRGIARARELQAEALIIQLDTPGGLLESTKDIVQLFLDSDDMPIVVYVAPEGGRAASAGTFITMAAHIAAMAPATTIGAASPVQMGGGQQDSVMQKKIFNYSESFIESVANRRDRNAEWAKSAVRDGESITAAEALELNVIDFISSNREEVLEQIDGRVIGGDTLQTRNATIEEIPTNLAESLLSFIMRPEVMLILTMIAIYGIIGEVTNPGAIVPGVAGVIALILVLYASASMPINIAGFALIGLAIVLFVAEAFTPAFGILIGGGAVAFFLGALMLFQDLPQSMELSWAWLVPATVLTTLFFVWIVTEGIRIQFSGNITGKESMIGRKAEIVEPIKGGRGRIFISGEYWNAVSDEEIGEGETCEIIEIDGLTAKVKRST
ncbi:Nodulation efficiency protein NfeD [Fodinibius roseus]|uniref:Nodulation efficiency protein NfeD n=1 Tax=Fodinibius roseus TaxID=1194090 RepID=A0A1M5FNI5_9BACT|nr:nodulation protein NfeD [Fodinibius roseus]SHF92989.1 Nodulation efficiency protein NfeD [Fodinibius roseus]